MNLLISTIVLYITCQGNTCHTIDVSPEAAAIAACESGDTVTLGSVDWYAVGYNGTWSIDTGAWQFNSYWIWNPDKRWLIDVVAPRVGLTSDDFVEMYPTAAYAPPEVQYEMFKALWNNGYGYQNWSASQKCWSKWLTIENGRAVFVGAAHE